MYVSNVEKLLFVPVTSKNMGEFTLERSPLHVSYVEKALSHPFISDNMSKCTLE
jgi:hypothetical protein